MHKHLFFKRKIKHTKTRELRGAQEPKAQPLPDFGGEPPGYKLLTKELLDKRLAREKAASQAEK